MAQLSSTRIHLPRSRGTLRFWIFTYLFIFLISIFVCSFAFINSYHTIERFIMQRSERMLEQMGVLLDGYLLQAQKALINLRLDARFDTVVNIPAERSGSQTYQYYEFKKLLNNYRVANDIFVSLELYFHKSDTVITNSSIQAFDLYPYLKEAKFTPRDWLTAFAALEQKATVASRTDGGQPYVAQRIQSTSGNRATAVAVLDALKMKESLAEYCSDASILAAVDPMGDVMFANGSDIPLGLDYQPDKSRYEDITLPSAQSDWTYHYLIPLTIYNQERNRALSQMALALLVSLVLGTASVYYFTKRSYSPLLKLLQYIQPNQQLPDANEYELIRQSIVSTQQKLYEVQIEQQRQELMFQLLMGKLKYSQLTPQTLQKVRQHFKSPAFCWLSSRPCPRPSTQRPSGKPIWMCGVA